MSSTDTRAPATPNAADCCPPPPARQSTSLSRTLPSSPHGSTRLSAVSTSRASQGRLKSEPARASASQRFLLKAETASITGTSQVACSDNLFATTTVRSQPWKGILASGIVQRRGRCPGCHELQLGGRTPPSPRQKRGEGGWGVRGLSARPSTSPEPALRPEFLTLILPGGPPKSP